METGEIRILAYLIFQGTNIKTRACLKHTLIEKNLNFSYIIIKYYKSNIVYLTKEIALLYITFLFNIRHI